MRFARGTAVLLLSAALVAGCGGYTKQDFIARADAICASTVRQTRLIAPPNFAGTGGERLHALAGYVTKVLPLVESEAKQLRALPRPKQNAPETAELASFVNAFSAVAADYESLQAAATKSDARGVTGAEAALTASPVTSLATRYGLRSCGTAGATTDS